MDGPGTSKGCQVGWLGFDAFFLAFEVSVVAFDVSVVVFDVLPSEVGAPFVLLLFFCR